VTALVKRLVMLQSNGSDYNIFKKISKARSEGRSWTYSSAFSKSFILNT
jgi:hypothetical protein